MRKIIMILCVLCIMSMMGCATDGSAEPSPSAEPAPSMVAIPTIPSTPAPKPELLENPFLLTDEPESWPRQVYAPYFEHNDYDLEDDAVRESEEIAQLLTTPLGYNIYLMKGYKYRELLDGISVSPSGPRHSLDMLTYPADTNIKAKVIAFMGQMRTELTDEEEIDEGPFHYAWYGPQVLGSGNVAVTVYQMENTRDDRIILACIAYDERQPAYVKNLKWMAKSFRPPER